MKKFLILAFILFGVKAFAQPASQLSLSAINFPDTAQVNQAYDFKFIITNIDSSNFTGSVSVKFKVDTVVSTFGSNQTSGLVTFDTLSVDIFNYTFDPNAQFRMGDNVVVVWPSISNEPAGDSLILHVFIPDPNGIDENKHSTALKLYPNPVKNLLTISISDIDKTVEQVRIYTLTGQMIHQENKHSKTIDISHLPIGVYLLEVATENETYYQKLFKE